MKVDGKNIRPIWLDADVNVVKVIDQRRLPHEFVVERRALNRCDRCIRRISGNHEFS